MLQKLHKRKGAMKTRTKTLTWAILATTTIVATTPTAHAHTDDAVVKTLTQTDEKPDVRNKITSLIDKIKLVTPKAVAPTTGIFTSGYEWRWGSFHDGIDIANSTGTPIYAAKKGTVIDSGPQTGYGNWIRIKHEDGYTTLYGHMNKLYVEVGQEVEAGEYIADMGNEGFSTGPHLHFGVYNTQTGESINPLEWLTENKINNWTD